MGNPVVHFEIAGKNGESLSEFYCSLFDWNSNGNVNGVYGLDPASENDVCGHILPTTDDMPSNYVTFYVQVDDLQASLEKAESLGGKTCVPPQVIPGGDMGSFAMFFDPSGNCVGLYQPKT